MLGISSSTAPRYDSWDMDHLDYYQHYFYDDHHNPEEDFFKATAPSEDIWKKFELVPTPPMSPIRTVEGLGRFGLVCPTLGDKLEWVSQFLGQEDEQQQQQQDPPCKVTPATDSVGNLSSIIIQDCMWSGFSTGWQLERMVGERCHPCQAKGGPASTKVVTGTSPGRAQGVPADALPLGCLVADCVDPGAVLTFPLGGGCKKQISSGSESHTNSSDDEDDQDEDEEEIDVVTVEHKQKRKPRRLVNNRKPATITVPVDPLDPGMKRFHISIHQQQHNYAAPSPDTLPPSSAELPPRKRIRHEASSAAHHQPSQHYHQPRLGHAPSKFDCRRSHVIVAGARSESPDLGALSPTSPASPSSAELPPRKRIRHEASAPAHHQPSQHYHQPRLGHAPSKFDCKRSHAIVAGARLESPDLGALSPTSPASPSSPHCSSSSSSSSSSPPPPLSSPQSSDCEDTDRRKTHNYLERKRRNDLRSRFLLLRDEIPGLADCAKTSKATILTRATEYLRQLHACERQQAQERKQLKAKQAHLLQRLAQLKRS